MASSLPLDELNHLYQSLSPEGRDELLQCLLVAASKSGEMVIQRPEERLMLLAGERLIEGLPEK